MGRRLPEDYASRQANIISRALLIMLSHIDAQAGHNNGPRRPRRGHLRGPDDGLFDVGEIDEDRAGLLVTGGVQNAEEQSINLEVPALMQGS